MTRNALTLIVKKTIQMRKINSQYNSKRERRGESNILKNHLITFTFCDVQGGSVGVNMCGTDSFDVT